MTSTKLINEKASGYNRKFQVEIDLSDCDDSDIQDILKYLDKSSEIKYNWIYELVKIIKNEM